jgi:hypothetical protein
VQLSPIPPCPHYVRVNVGPQRGTCRRKIVLSAKPGLLAGRLS